METRMMGGGQHVLWGVVEIHRNRRVLLYRALTFNGRNWRYYPTSRRRHFEAPPCLANYAANALSVATEPAAAPKDDLHWPTWVIESSGKCG